MGARSGHLPVLLPLGHHDDRDLILSLPLSRRIPPPCCEEEEGYAFEQKLLSLPLEHHRVLVLSPWQAKKVRGKGEGECVNKHTAPTFLL